MSPPLRLLLDGQALVANWRWLQAQQPGAACGAAVKADGYGLGAKGVAARLGEAGCRDFFVAHWSEAVALGPVAGSLSVLHGVRAEDMPVALAYGARPILNSPEQVTRWRDAGGGPCDVMVDTGMNRLGLTPADACSGLLDGLTIETLLSHLACADEPDHPLNPRQLAAFRDVRGRIAARRYSLANSAGICLRADYGFDLTRPGIGLYGGVPVEGAGTVAVVRIAAQVLQVRAVAVGETVGYGATWAAPRESRIAILNLGYADGVLRQLGPHLVADGARPFVGRVSMDLIAIDVTDAPVGEGDWIELPLDLPRLEAATALSQYEILTGLGDRFDRLWR